MAHRKIVSPKVDRSLFTRDGILKIYFNTEEQKNEVMAAAKKQSDKGDVASHILLAECLDTEDISKGRDSPHMLWYLSAVAGSAYANYRLGKAFYEGSRIHKDYRSAKKYIGLAAEGGFVFAQFKLGDVLYIEEEKPKEAVMWWRKAAEDGHPEAQYCLGNAYDQGDGVEQNKIEAINWWRKAAEQGERQAQYNLACAYLEGEGVEKKRSRRNRVVNKSRR
eukprot:TRINITY_DN24809_c0_g1_i1.p1 TRINITY_DN24809_c0_g1~~TRINITY_DN24809_c0_g1_i1.p1  ORF type:complete len:229 (-),score=43.45 TRINITY_DN24809_c0_g1_i1:266-928(-)